MGARMSGRSSKNLTFVVLVSAAVLNLLFGFFKLLNLLQIRYFLFYSPKIVDIVIFSQEVDFWIWAISLFTIVTIVLVFYLLPGGATDGRLLILCFATIASFSVFMISASVATVLAVPLGFLLLFFFVNRGFLGGVERFNVAILTLLGVVCLLVFFELASLSTWTWNIFSYESPFSDLLHWRFASLDLQLFNAAYPLTSLLFIALLYCWIFVPVGKALFSRVFGRKPMIVKSHLERVCVRHRLLVLSLTLITVVAAFVVSYAYFRLPSLTLVGTDSTYYYERVQDMSVNGVLTALQTDRPVSDFVLFFVHQACDVGRQCRRTDVSFFATQCVFGSGFDDRKQFGVDLLGLNLPDDGQPNRRGQNMANCRVTVGDKCISRGDAEGTDETTEQHG